MYSYSSIENVAWKSSSWLLSVKIFPYSINNSYECVCTAANIGKMLYPWVHILITHRKLFLCPKLVFLICLTCFQSDHDYRKVNKCFTQAYFIWGVAGNCGIAVNFTLYLAFTFQNQTTFDHTNKSLRYLCYVIFFPIKQSKTKKPTLNWKLTFHNYYAIFKWYSLLGENPWL